MPLVLGLARPADARRIAEIHMAAFGDNAMLRAQFPSAALREAGGGGGGGLRDAIEAKARADMGDSKTSVLVVRDTDVSAEGDVGGGDGGEGKGEGQGPVVAFAKWSHPVAPGEQYVEPPWVMPAGTDRAVLKSWTRKVEEAQERAVGRTPCFRTYYLPTYSPLLLSYLCLPPTQHAQRLRSEPAQACFALIRIRRKNQASHSWRRTQHTAAAAPRRSSWAGASSSARRRAAAVAPPTSRVRSRPPASTRSAGSRPSRRSRWISVKPELGRGVVGEGGTVGCIARLALCIFPRRRHDLTGLGQAGRLWVFRC